MKAISFASVFIGFILIVITMGNFRRKSELEVSSSPTASPMFKVGVALIIIGILAFIISLA